MPNNHNPFSSQADLLAYQQLKTNWNWYFVAGVALVALGTAALIFSYTSTLISVMYLGMLVAGLGLFELAQSFKMNRWTTFFLHLFLGILYIVGGIFIVIYPGLNALTLTLLLAFFFIISGIARMIFALAKHLPHRVWIFINGAITLLLGILIWKEWPSSGLWVLGMFVGIEMIFTGWTWIMLSLMAKNMKLENVRH